jgi:hypothetical protein
VDERLEDARNEHAAAFTKLVAAQEEKRRSDEAAALRSEIEREVASLHERADSLVEQADELDRQVPVLEKQAESGESVAIELADVVQKIAALEDQDDTLQQSLERAIIEGESEAVLQELADQRGTIRAETEELESQRRVVDARLSEAIAQRGEAEQLAAEARDLRAAAEQLRADAELVPTRVARAHLEKRELQKRLAEATRVTPAPKAVVIGRPPLAQDGSGVFHGEDGVVFNPSTGAVARIA